MTNLLNLLRREPAQIAGFIAAAVQLLTSLLLPLTVDQQGAWNAVTVILVGFVTAFGVSAEKAAPFIAGLIQALIALAASYGLLLAPQVQSSLMVVVAGGVAFFLRTQVFATLPITVTPIAASDSKHAA